MAFTEELDARQDVELVKEALSGLWDSRKTQNVNRTPRFQVVILPNS